MTPERLKPNRTILTQRQPDPLAAHSWHTRLTQ